MAQELHDSRLDVALWQDIVSVAMGRIHELTIEKQQLQSQLQALRAEVRELRIPPAVRRAA